MMALTAGASWGPSVLDLLHTSRTGVLREQRPGFDSNGAIRGLAPTREAGRPAVRTSGSAASDVRTSSGTPGRRHRHQCGGCRTPGRPGARHRRLGVRGAHAGLLLALGHRRHAAEEQHAGHRTPQLLGRVDPHRLDRRAGHVRADRAGPSHQRGLCGRAGGARRSADCAARLVSRSARCTALLGWPAMDGPHCALSQR